MAAADDTSFITMDLVEVRVDSLDGTAPKFQESLSEPFQEPAKERL